MTPVQRRAEAAPLDGAEVQATAAAGLTGAATALPFADQIARSFGPDHDVTGIRAHVGGPASDAARAIGASAYATGNAVAFASAPDLHLAAHEAAHVVQQRHGVSLKGGVGQAGDTYEQHADAVADRVVAGHSAADLLAPYTSSTGAVATQRAVQRWGATEHSDIGTDATGGKVIETDLGGGKKTREIVDGNMCPLADGYALPFGDVISLAGDHFESIDQMRRFAKNTSGGAESRGEIEYARVWKLYYPRDKAVFDDAAKASQEKRYYALAMQNRRHFAAPEVGDASRSIADRAAGAPNPEDDIMFGEYRFVPSLGSAVQGYRYYHLRALATAARDGAAGKGFGDAYAEEAFGCHFLTDSFSAGHVRTERAGIKDYWDATVPMFNYNLKGYIAETMAKALAPGYSVGPLQVRADVIYDPPFASSKGALGKVTATLDKKGPMSFGDVVSGALHDHDNQNGLVAVSGGQAVTLFGDGHLKDKDNDGQRLAVQAVARGAGEVTHAHRLGKSGMAPKEVIASLIGDDRLFSPERLIPTALPDAAQGPDRAKINWKFPTADALLADPRFGVALKTFADEQKGELTSAVDDFDADQKAAFVNHVVNPLGANPAGVLRATVNWTPSLDDSFMNRNSDDHANDYWQRAKRTPGGLKSLTYTQRENLIGRLLSGVTIGDDEDAIMDLLRTAPRADAEALIGRFGWSTLHDNIDDGFGNAFADTFPRT